MNILEEYYMTIKLNKLMHIYNIDERYNCAYIVVKFYLKRVKKTIYISYKKIYIFQNKY